MTNVNLDGQPINRHWNQKLRIDRGIHEMLGLIKGVLMDGVVSDQEVYALDNWLRANGEIADVWPASVVVTRLKRILADGVVSADEKKDLKNLLQQTTGDLPNQILPQNKSTALPFSRPEPLLRFENQIFVFTGKFYYGTRKQCEESVLAREGLCESRVTQRMNYLVIGALGSADWIHSSFGRKIEQAVQYREVGQRLDIVSEEHWTKFVMPENK